MHTCILNLVRCLRALLGSRRRRRAGWSQGSPLMLSELTAMEEDVQGTAKRYLKAARVLGTLKRYPRSPTMEERKGPAKGCSIAKHPSLPSEVLCRNVLGHSKQYRDHKKVFLKTKAPSPLKGMGVVGSL